MAKLQNYLSELVFEQLPEFVQDQYPLFVDFIHAYYRFLQEDKNAQDIIQNAKTYSEIETTLTELIPSFFAQYGEEAPRNTQANTALFIKKISDLYASKGTEKGYRLLFNILYKEAIDFYYPYSNVLKSSDGKWVRTYRLFAYQEGNSDLFKFENTTITGATSGATAVVSSVIRYSEEGLMIYELGLDEQSVTGNFSSYEKITARKLLRVNGSNDADFTIRDDLLDSEVYDYYKNRRDELRRVLFKDEAGNNVGTRRLVNLGIRYGWTEDEVLYLYNSIFGTTLNSVTWSRTTPKANHPATLTASNSYNYYLNNPTVFEDVVTENNAFTATVDQRIISTAFDFGWSALQTATVVNKALRRSTIPAEWDIYLQPTGPAYELVTGLLYPMLADIDVVSPGLGYRVGETVQITSDTGVSAIAEVYEVNNSGGIKNIKMLRPGPNYDANTVLTIPRINGRLRNALQTIKSRVATVKFDQEHGLKKGDLVTIADENFIPSESNVVTISVFAAGKYAADTTHGVFLDSSTVDLSNSNVGYNVSVYGSDEKAFIEHRSFDTTNGVANVNIISEGLSADEYEDNYYVGLADFSNILYVNNLGNIGGGNVHVLDSTNTLIALNLQDVDTHQQIKFSGTLHFVGQWYNEQVIVYDNDGALYTITKGSAAPTVTTNLINETHSYIGKQSYSSAGAAKRVILDLGKEDEYEASTDVWIGTYDDIEVPSVPASIYPVPLASFGYLSTNQTFNTPTDTYRSITTVGKYSLENTTTLYFEVFRGGSVWGDAPEAGEELKLQYSEDGIAWTNIVTVSVAVSDTAWTLVTAAVPVGAKVSTGVYIRFYQDGSNDLPAPRDTWAFTSLVNDITAFNADYGRLEFDTNWIEHNNDNIELYIRCAGMGVGKEVYLSNLSVDIQTNPSLEMSDYINSITGDDIIVVHSWGDAAPNRLIDGLEDSMLSIGASREIYVDTFLTENSAYVLIGKPGIGEANGLERVASFANNSPSNFTQMNFKIDNGSLVGESFAVVSIPDYKSIQYNKSAPDGNSNVSVLLESTANLSPRISPLVISEPFWRNNDGMLSDAVFVQGRTRTANEDDPVYYQTFSYVIRSEHPISQWRQYATDLMHPAGMQLFGELKLQTLPSNLINMAPVAVSTEVQDFFAITADKADRTHPDSPEFRTDMTYFPARNLESNPSLLELTTESHAVSQTKVASDYMTAECFFKKLPDPLGPFETSPLPEERILFSKFRTYEVRTDAGKLWYRIQTFSVIDNRLYDWYWVDTGVTIEYGVPYVLALTYDGSYGKLYLNGTLVHRASNAELRRSVNNNPGVLANKDVNYVKLNSSGKLRDTRLNPGHHGIGRFLVYDRALSEAELRENYLNLKGEFAL